MSTEEVKSTETTNVSKEEVKTEEVKSTEVKETSTVTKEEEKPINKEEKKTTFDSYKIVGLIGNGAFGKVVKAISKEDGKTYCLKLLSKNRVVKTNMLSYVKNEFLRSIDLNHPNIVRYKEFFHTDGMLCYAMSYYPGGTLKTALKNNNKLSEKEVQFISAQLVLALEYLHSNDIIYRDLRPQNVMFDEKGNVKLIDFALSTKTKKTETTFCGGAEYLSPEMIDGEEYYQEVDLWALGCVVYEMLVGVSPFHAEEKYDIFDNIKSGKIDFPKSLSDTTKDLISSLLNINKEKRLKTADDVKKHAFFKDVDWKKLLSSEVTSPFDPKVKSSSDKEEELSKKQLAGLIDPKFENEEETETDPWSDFSNKKNF